MLVGYNTNISYKDKTYHVQTEDNGRNNPVIVTLLYSQGAILASRKTNYTHLIEDPDLNEKVRKLMKVQHKGMIKELLAGKYSGESGEDEETNDVREPEVVPQKQEEIVDARFDEPGESEPQEHSAKQSSEANAGTKDRLTKSLDDILLNYILKRDK